MATQSFHHGIRVFEVNEGTNVLRIISTAVIGMVVTASDANAEFFPLNKPVLVTNISRAQANAGTKGTLKAALDRIALQCRPTMIIVRVEDGVGDTEEEQQADLVSKVVGTNVGGVRTGIQALLAAQGQTGVRPRILGAPGLDSKPVADALASACEALRAFSYVYAWGAEDVSEVLQYREQFGQKETMVIWPNVMDWDTATNKSVAADAVAYALGKRAHIDQEFGWHKSLSNVVINGPTGLAKDVTWDLQSASSDAALLNQGDITTIINHKGYRFWGNRTCSADDNFVFEVAVRTGQILADTIAEGFFDFLDKPMSPRLVRDIVESINARFRSLKADGYILGGRAWFNEEINTTENLKSGKLVIDYDYTPVPPLEDLSFRQRITDKYLVDFSAQMASAS